MLSQRFNKACDSCHISKVRCVPDPQSPTGTTCKRCTKNGTACVFSPVGPRRRPMRTKNERIAELERRVKDMQLKLEKQVEKRTTTTTTSSLSSTSKENTITTSPDFDLVAAASLPSSSGLPNLGPGDASGSTANDESRSALTSQVPLPQVQQHHHPHPPHPHQPQPATTTTQNSPASDALDQGLITPTQADYLVLEFRAKLHGKYLGICLPDGPSGTSAHLRRHRPTFWLSVLCAASASSLEYLPLAPLLFGELKKILDQRITPSADPDLDALQALMIYVSFHYDPVFPLGEQLLPIYRTAVAMAVSMAEASRIHSIPIDEPLAEEDVTEADVQLSRELCHWYWASFSLAIKSRTSSMLRKTNLVEASLRVLRIAGTQADLFLMEWIKMARIGADTAVALHSGHTGQGEHGLSDEARDEILDGFERRRKKWLVECPFDLVNETLMLEYHYHVLLISEVVYPAGVADFRHRSQGLPPISLPPSSSSSSPKQPSTTDQNLLAPYKIRYTRKCITAAHACLDLITSPSSTSPSSTFYSPYSLPNSDDLLRRFGVLPYGRIFYALRFLLFLAHEIWKTGRYDIVDVGSLRIGGYIASLKRCLKTASAGGRYRTPSLWVYALRTRIEPWYRELCVLLERDRQSVKKGGKEEVEGDRTPRAMPSPILPPVPSSNPKSSPTTRERRSKTDNTISHQIQDAVPAADDDDGDFFSPLLFDFPFEILSSGGLPSSLSSRGNTTTTTTTDKNDTQSPQKTNLGSRSTMPSASSSIPPNMTIPPPQLEQQHQQQYITHSGPLQQQQPLLPNGRFSSSQPPPPPPVLNPNSNDFTASFEDMDIYNNPLDFNWGDFGDIFPGSDMFLSPFPPLGGTNEEMQMPPRDFGSGAGTGAGAGSGSSPQIHQGAAGVGDESTGQR